MDHHARTRPSRDVRGSTLAGAVSMWLGGGAAAALAWMLGTRLAALTTPAAHTRVDALVELGIVAAGAAVLVWLALSCTVAAACLTVRAAGGGWRRGEAWVHRWAPVVVRRTVVLAVGAGLGLSAATGASAADRPPTASPAPSVSATVTGVGGTGDLGWVPTEQPTTTTPPRPAPQGAAETTRPDTAVTPDPGGSAGTGHGEAPATGSDSATTPTVSPAPAPSHPAPGAVLPTATQPSSLATAPGTPSAPTRTATTVTVAAGDTLWAIAARYLPVGADDRQIATAWPIWYAANAATIGADPDVIRPGQTLDVPADLEQARS